MSEEGRRGSALLASAAVLGVVGDVLFHGRPLGLNVLLFVLCFTAALALLLRAGRAPWHQGRRWMVAPLLLFAAAFAWHDSPLLTLTNLLALAGAVALGALRRTRPAPQDASLGDYAAGLAAAGAGTFAGTIDLLERDVPWDDVTRGIRGPRAAAVGRGLAIGLPFLLVFGALFLAADAVFRRLAESAVPTGVPSLWPHLVVAFLVAWASAGLLRDLAEHREERRLVSPEALVRRRAGVTIGGTEVAVALAALDVLFLAFVVVQGRYLFGGESVVLTHAHLTYAQYARHGFFELLAVSVLVVPVILAANAVAREHRTLVRVLSGVLVVLELAVAASALQRMRVYVDHYGLTELRVYTTGVMLWIAVVLVWCAATVLRGHGRRFAVGVVAAGFAATLALDVVSPDALIARTNLDRGAADPAYIAGLSADAVPTIVARLPRVADANRRARIARVLLTRRFDDDALAWNAARAQARESIARNRALLERLAGR
jgi:Domain of unknown function (DUF4173)